MKVTLRIVKFIGVGVGLLMVVTLSALVGYLIGGQALMIIATELVMFVIIMVPLLMGLAWKLAQQDKFFTLLQTGDIKFVVAGESFDRTFINIPGKVLQDGRIVDAKSVGRDAEKEKTWLQRRFGLYWVGIYPFRQIYSFKIPRERENREVKPGMKAEDWITRETDATVTELRWKFPRPVLVPEVEFVGTLRADILVLCKFEVLEPVVPVFIQKAKFFDILASYTRNGVIEYCQDMTLEDFIGADKKDGGEMSKNIITHINSFVESELGIRLTGLWVSNYETSDKETQTIMEARQRAKLQGQANIEAAERQKQVAITTAQGQAEADKIRASARITDIIETVKQLRAEQVDPNTAAVVAGAVGRAERFTRADSKLTTLVDGSGSSVAVPLPQGGKR